jgi:hypothetical protein
MDGCGDQNPANPFDRATPAAQLLNPQRLLGCTRMTDTVDDLVLDLLEWIARKERSYQETVEAWRTSCPKLPVWEDANDRRLIEIVQANGRSVVRPAAAGMAFLKVKRPRVYAELQRQSG